LARGFLWKYERDVTVVIVKYIAFCLVFLTTEGVNFSREIPAQILYNLEPLPEHKFPDLPIHGGNQSC
jgi:hypothetical protein